MSGEVESAFFSVCEMAHIVYERDVLTTVLFIGVILAVVVAITHPGAPDAFAVVAVEVQRRAGGKHCKQTSTGNKSVNITDCIAYTTDQQKTNCEIAFFICLFMSFWIVPISACYTPLIFSSLLTVVWKKQAEICETGLWGVLMTIFHYL